MERLDQQTLNFTDEHIANIAAMFPHCVTEVEDENGELKKAIDFDLLKQELSHNIVDGSKERYRIDWPGKRASLVSANTPTTKTLRPAVDESVNFDTTQNLYIEGDNLEALKLLQASYLGEIKMIYIDPPYNTGKDFVYNDNFTRSKEEELEASGQVDEEGGRLVANLESNGRFHSDWLNMMYTRLRLARNLLKDDGIIFVSIDDNEVANLRKLGDEIFGENNFITQIAWRRQDGQTNIGNIARVKEYIIVYGKSNNIKLGRLPLSDKAKKDYQYQDERGFYGRGRLREPVRGRYNYEVTTPSGTIAKGPWLIPEKDFEKLDNEGLVHWPKGGGSPRKKIYLKDMLKKGQIANDFWGIEFGTNQRASLEVESLFDQRLFDFPKPVSLLVNIINIGSTDSDDIILDFFSGSATTAHAVMQYNAENGSNRKFIMVQLPEETNEKSKAYKAGYKTIPELGKERIRRAGKKIVEENANKEGIENLDIGFRVLKIDESNMKDIYFSPDEVDKSSLFDTVDHIKEDRTPEDLLFGVLVDWGVDLTLPIRREDILGKTVFFVGYDDLTACFDEDLDEAFITELASKDAMRVVFKESGFKNDEIKINAEQIFTQLSPGTDLKVI